MESGGMMGDSKINMMRHIPEKYSPKTLYISAYTGATEEVEAWMEREELTYPIIGKPDVGERGLLVRKITSTTDLENYLLFNREGIDFIIQEYIDLPVEMGILYYRFPNTESGVISSICHKVNLQVTGNGRSTLQELIFAYPRAILQWERIKDIFAEQLNDVPQEGEVIHLDPFGNHSKGATFLDANHLHDQQLVYVFNAIGRQMKGIYYGRFDLRCASIEELTQGRNFKILEFNGTAGEPAHIYDPKHSIWYAYRNYFQHWRIIYRISKLNMQYGIRPVSLREGCRIIDTYRRYLKKAKRLEK